MKKRGNLILLPESLFQLLGLKNATLLDIKINHFGSGHIDMVIESPDMPECPEGAYPQNLIWEESKCRIQ